MRIERATTYDEAALELLLDNDQAGLAKLLRHGEIAIGVRCPFCDSGKLETGGEAFARCLICGEEWDTRDFDGEDD